MITGSQCNAHPFRVNCHPSLRTFGRTLRPGARALCNARRYEDNQEPVTHLMVMKNPTDRSSITAWGGPDKFLEQYKFLLGQQVFAGVWRLLSSLAADLP